LEEINEGRSLSHCFAGEVKREKFVKIIKVCFVLVMLFVCLFVVCLLVCLFACLLVCLFACLLVCLFACYYLINVLYVIVLLVK
jgi:hypothetical protein